MNKRISIDPKSGLMTVQKSSGVHPFLRASNGSEGAGATKLTNPLSQSVWALAAIMHIASPISSVPIKFTEDKRGGDVTVDDPDLNKFWEKPAANCGVPISRTEFIKATCMWVLLKGEAFWIMDDSWLTSTANKSPLILARPDRMRPIFERRGGELNGWKYRDQGGREQYLIPDQVVHIREYNPFDPIRGLSRWEAAKLAASSDYAAGVFAKRLMENNGDRGPIVTSDGSLTEEQIQQITETLRQKQDMSRRGEMRPVFLAAPNIKVDKPDVQAVDDAFNGQRMENRHEIYVAFGVPPSFADVTNSYSVGSASDRYKLIEEGCIPLASLIAEGVEQVSTQFRRTGGTLYAEFDFDEHSTMQQVRAERFDIAVKGVEKGMPWKTANEYLKLGLPEFTGWEIGRVPFNLRDIESGSEPSAKESAADQPSKAGVVLDEIKSLFACRAHGPQSECKDAADSMREVDPERQKLWEGLVKLRTPWVKAFDKRFNRHLMDARRETLSNIAKLPESKAITKAQAVNLIFDLGEWLRNFLGGMSDVSRNAMIQAGYELVEHELDRDDPVEMPATEVMVALERRENYLSNTGVEIWNEVRHAIAESIEAGETTDQIAERVRETFNGISKERSQAIAVTETGAAYEAGRAITMREAGVEWKEWLTSQDERVRLSHWSLDGKKVEMDQPFELSNGVKLMHPCESGAPASEVINCRCITIAASGPEN